MDSDVKKLIAETVDNFLSEISSISKNDDYAIIAANGYDRVGVNSFTNDYELKAAIKSFIDYYGHSPFNSPYTCKVGMPEGAPESWEASPEDIQWYLVDRWRHQVPRSKRKAIEAKVKAEEDEKKKQTQQKLGLHSLRQMSPKHSDDEFAADKLSDITSLMRENGQTEPKDQTSPSVLPLGGEKKYEKQEPGGIMSAVNIEEIQSRIASIDEDSFRVYNETLCPMLWDEYKHLNPRVRVNLLRMAYDFYDKTNFQAPIKDVYLMGSAANYNWTPDSDADVHVIVDFNQLKMPIETAEKAAKIAGASWNNEHKVWAKGHKVEINIQNSNEPKPHVTGIYSIVHDQWVRTPSHQNVEVNKPLIQQKYSAMKDYIVATVQSGNYELMKQAKKYLDAFRQYGLDSRGELSIENIVFKILRSRGFIKNLKDAITSRYDKDMTVTEDMPWKDDNVEFEGKTEDEKIALIKKLIPKLNDDMLVATVNKFPEMPQASYVQVDMVYDGINYFSSNAENLNRFGYKMPSTQELLKLPTGKYKLSDVKKKLQLNEVNQSDINAKYPPQSALHRTPWGKPINGNYDYSKLTLSNLKSMRSKEAQAIKYLAKYEDRFPVQHAMAQYRMIDAEIKRRLAYINAPVTESHDAEKLKLSFNHPDISKGSAKIMLGNIWFANTFKDVDSGKWIFNRHTGAFDMGLPADLFRAYDTPEALVQDVQKWIDLHKKSVSEGVGAGIPEDDRLHIPGHRWQIKSKDAPKTPKMKEELTTELEQINESIKSPHQPSKNGKSIISVLPELIRISKQGDLKNQIAQYLISQGWSEDDWSHQATRYLAHVNSGFVNGVRNALRDKDLGISSGNDSDEIASQFSHALKSRKKYDLEEKFVNELVEQLLTESPKLDVLKKNRKMLTDDERNAVISGGAVWPGDQRPGVWKSEVDGKTWYVCNTHRAYQCKPTIKGAIKAFKFIETTS